MPVPSWSPLASLGFSVPGWQLWLVVALALFIAPWVAVRAYRDTEPRVHGRRRALLTGLRLLSLWLLLALVADPVLFRSHTVRVDPSVLFLVDDSASMAVASADGTTRYQNALRQRVDAAEEVAAVRGPARLWFGEGSRRLEHSSRSGAEAPDEPTGEGTDLRSLLVSATQRHLEDELTAIVLFSDGMSTSPDSPVSLSGLNVPVFTVAANDSAGPSDLGLARIRYPSRVASKDELAVTGEVVVRAPMAGRTTLRLRQGEAILDSIPVQWEAGRLRQPFEFVVAPDTVGYARYELQLVPVADENVLRNNAVQIGVRVEKDRLRVLHLASVPGWDAHFLRHAVSADRRIQWDTAVRTPEGWRLAGQDSLLAWPLPPEELASIDLFVAGRTDDLARLGESAAGVLDAVRGGAGLWILASDPAQPPEWPASIRAVSPLVPGRRARWIPTEARASLPVEARSHAVWALAPEAGDVDAALSRIPPLRSTIAPMDVSVDADLLLRAGTGQATSPVLAVRREGQGRVAVFNGAPLWSWSFWRLGDDGTQEFFTSLVRNLVTWMAEGGDRERLRLQVPRPVVARGEEFELRALALDAQLRPDTRQDVWLEWTPAEGDTTVAGRVRMAPDPELDGGRVAELPALPPGEYRLRATMEESSATLSSRWERITIDPFSVEYRDPRVDRVQLAAIARATGGELLEPGDFAAWARGLDLTERERVLTGRIDLGARLWLLVPLLLLLSVEWALRKRFGLI